MNPILQGLHSKQWVWTAANAKQESTTTKLATGFDNLDKHLHGGFPRAGMIHLQSALGSGELRFMLSILQHLARQQSNGEPLQSTSGQPNFARKLFAFINPPLQLNAEFLLAQHIPLEQLVHLPCNNIEDALWSTEQCAKSGACCAVFLWPKQLSQIQIRKLELAALHGGCYCIWMDSAVQTHATVRENLPLSLSLSITRQQQHLHININKQKVGWARSNITVSLPFNSRISKALKQRRSAKTASNVVAFNFGQ